MEDVDVDIDLEEDNDVIGKEKMGFTFSNINNGVPCVGMFFETLDEVEKLYRDYGRNFGFEIIIRITHRHAQK